MMRGSVLKIICMLILAVIANAAVYGQEVKATAKLDSATVLIGDQVKLRLSVDLPASWVLHWPALNDTITKSIEVVSRSRFDTVATPGQPNIVISQMITLTCFDSGYFAIPPFEFICQKPGDTSRIIARTNPVLLTVNTIPVDTTADYKDIKPPLKVPLTFREILPWLLLALGILTILGAGIYIFIRLKNKKSIIALPSKPKVPAHITALAELEKLRVAHLWQYGKVKEYHSRLSDILRIYIEGRWGIIAMEMITDDIIESLINAGVSKDNRDMIRKVLQVTDMVKFAKFNPLSDENDLVMKKAVDFVMLTKPEEKESNGSSASNEDMKMNTEPEQNN